MCEYMVTLKKSLGCTLLSLSALTFVSCATGAGGGYQSGKNDNPYPSQTANVVINLSRDTGISVVDPDTGREIQECRLLSEKEFDSQRYKPKYHKQDRTDNVCIGLVDATIHNIDSITIIRSSINPYCWTVVENGKAKQKCVGN